jgi:hypothetical protein
MRKIKNKSKIMLSMVVSIPEHRALLRLTRQGGGLDPSQVSELERQKQEFHGEQ